MPVAKVIRVQRTGPGEKDFAEKEVQVPFGFYDLYNPLRARRIIYDGIENETKIVIEPGQKVGNVRLAEVIFNDLKKRNGDLKIALSATQAPVAAPPPADNGKSQPQLGE